MNTNRSTDPARTGTTASPTAHAATDPTANANATERMHREDAAVATALRTALAKDAASAPLDSTPPEWPGPVALIGRAPTRRRTLVVGVTLAAAAALLGGLVLTRPPNGEEQAAGAPPPPGVPEVPLVDLGPPDASTGLNEITVAGLSRVIRLAGHPDMVVYPAAQYLGGPTLASFRCMGSDGGAGCAPTWMGSHPNLGQTSTIDNRAGEFDAWTWENVPAGTAYVLFDEGGRRAWQRPVAGLVAFPLSHTVTAAAAPSSAISASAIDEDGAVIATADIYRVAPDDPNHRYPDVTRSQGEELSALGRATLRDCLTAAGATWSGSIATLPLGTDQQATWDGCVALAQAGVEAKITEWAPRFYDRSTERPEVADPMLQFGSPPYRSNPDGPCQTSQNGPSELPLCRAEPAAPPITAP